VTDRSASLSGLLARRGFDDPAWAESQLQRLPGVEPARLIEPLGAAADPDQALASLVALAEAGVDIGVLAADEPALHAFVTVAGTSRALAEHLVRHPGLVPALGRIESTSPTPEARRAVLLSAIGANPHDVEPVTRNIEAMNLLRVAYRDELVATAVRDLVYGAPLDVVGAELADLADAALDAGLAIARADLPADAEPCRLAVIAMGKCGGRELNYVSDVDVIFVAEPIPGGDEGAALKTATRLASGMMRACSESTPEGSLWQVDAALRPEGKQGALTRTLASHVGYYERWASTWEFQALLKARPAAGDRELGEAYIDAVSPFVWSAADRDGFVNDVQRMRQRVEDHVPGKEADRQLKLGRGGLRDVEFAVQLLQLVHGRSDVMLRSSTTLEALEALSLWGYVGREDGATLATAYRFLRTFEHRIQLQDLKRTHIVPESHVDLRRIGRSLDFRQDPVEELSAEWRRQGREVRRIHEKLFYRPLLNAVARLDAGDARLTTEAAHQRLTALGYTDPEGALRHLQALTSGVSRRAAIQRTLLPVLLGWFADGPDPDSALLGFRRMSDDLGSTPWYLRLLRDESLAAERMARILTASRFASDLLLRSPDGVSLLVDDADLQPRSRESLESEALSAVLRHDSAESAAAAIRSIRRRELFRISAADLLGRLSTQDAMVAITDVTTASLVGALQIAVRSAAAASPDGRVPTRFAIIAMGRYGGQDMGYASDADVMFVHDPLPGADEKVATDAAIAMANEVRRLLMAPSADPPLEVDADLRPEGRQGPLVRTLESYRAYYERWSSPWEAQALLRARPVAGDPDLGAAFQELIDPLRWPPGGLPTDSLREMRRLKARMESERLPRGADPTLHTKLGRGGLSDVEWVVQLLQMDKAAEVSTLRTTSTLDALDAARIAGLVDGSDAAVLSEAWLLATRVRNAYVLATGRGSDLIPSQGADLASVAFICGFDPPAELLEEYWRATRRARTVVERLFYG